MNDVFCCGERERGECMLRVWLIVDAVLFCGVDEEAAEMEVKGFLVVNVESLVRLARLAPKLKRGGVRSRRGGGDKRATR